MLLAKMTSREVAEYLASDERILLPVGSVEQHGPLGVVGTDYLIAVALAEKIAVATGTVCAPPVCYGMSQHHLGFAGTVSVSPMTLTGLYRDIFRSMYQTGFRRIMVVNGHGGNSASLTMACTEAADSAPDILIRLAEWYAHPKIKALIATEFGDEDGIHGMPSELSQIKFICDGLIGSGEHVLQPSQVLDVLLTGHVLRCRYPDGSINANQNLANADAGAKLFEVCVQVFTDDMRNWKRT